MFVQVTTGLKTLKLSTSKEAFSKPEGVKEAKLELTEESAFTKFLLSAFNNGDINIAIYPNNDTAAVELQLLVNKANEVAEKEAAAKKAKEYKPTNRGRDTASGKEKYDASDIPGNLALIRNPSLNAIYIGYRKHTYSYYNICCVSPETANRFQRDCYMAASATNLRNKDGSKKMAITTNSPELYEKWDNFMDQMYEDGIK